jgi:hypothetical protein
MHAVRARRGMTTAGVVGAVVILTMMTRCHGSDEVTSPWASVAGAYRADFVLPCGAQGSADVTVAQQGSEISAVVPGFGRIDCTAAATGQLPRISAATVTLDVGCGSTNVTYHPLPTDDGRVLSWFFPDGRGENCGCSGTTSITLTLTPR